MPLRHGGYRRRNAGEREGGIVIEQIDDAPAGVIAFRATGKVEADDYETVLRPAVDAAVETHDKIRIVFELGRWLGSGD